VDEKQVAMHEAGHAKMLEAVSPHSLIATATCVLPILVQLNVRRLPGRRHRPLKIATHFR